MYDFTGDHHEVKSRKDRSCNWCGEPIAKGERCMVQSGKYDGVMFRVHMHKECDAACAEMDCGEEYWPESMSRGCLSDRGDICDCKWCVERDEKNLEEAAQWGD